MQRILTRDDVKWEGPPIWAFAGDGQQWNGRGVLKLITKPTKEQQAATNSNKAVIAGRIAHEKLEHCTWGWLPEAKHYNEVFLAGNLFGNQCCSFADKLAINADGTGAIADTKFTSKPASARTPQLNPLYMQQIACYTYLANKFYGLQMAMPAIIWADIATRELLEIYTMPEGDFRGWLSLAKSNISAG